MNEVDFSFNGYNCPVLLDDQQEPWWIAKNVCEILQTKDTRQAVERLDEDEKMIGKIYLSSKHREAWLINEPGLYSLVLTSNKPEAKTFKRWITHEVLPSIRKTGSYEAGTARPTEAKPARPSLRAAADFMREARTTFGIRTARRVCKQYLGPENFAPLTRRKQPQEPVVPLSEYQKVVSEYKKLWPWGVTPEEDRWFRANMGNLSEEERDAFIARAAQIDQDNQENQNKKKNDEKEGER